MNLIKIFLASILGFSLAYANADSSDKIDSKNNNVEKVYNTVEQAAIAMTTRLSNIIVDVQCQKITNIESSNNCTDVLLKLSKAIEKAVENCEKDDLLKDVCGHINKMNDEIKQKSNSNYININQ